MSAPCPWFVVGVTCRNPDCKTDGCIIPTEAAGNGFDGPADSNVMCAVCGHAWAEEDAAKVAEVHRANNVYEDHMAEQEGRPVPVRELEPHRPDRNQLDLFGGRT